jgi:hypothetical protein
MMNGRAASPLGPRWQRNENQKRLRGEEYGLLIPPPIFRNYIIAIYLYLNRHQPLSASSN